jgi:major type 1 subunit fimbrin (pilin)
MNLSKKISSISCTSFSLRLVTMLLAGTLVMATTDSRADTSLSFNATGSIKAGVCRFTVADVDMKSFDYALFTGVGYATPWNNVAIVSQGCDQSVTKVGMSFLGTADADVSNLFKVTGGTSGIGVELLSPNDIQAVPNGARIDLNPIGAGATYAFKARFKQTRAQVTPGIGNAAITVQISYP